LWAAPRVSFASGIPQAVCLPQNPGPYQVAFCISVQLPVLGAGAGSGVVVVVVLPGVVVPPD
jgi:hypothetical protein